MYNIYISTDTYFVLPTAHQYMYIYIICKRYNTRRF